MLIRYLGENKASKWIRPTWPFCCCARATTASMPMVTRPSLPCGAAGDAEVTAGQAGPLMCAGESGRLAGIDTVSQENLCAPPPDPFDGGPATGTCARAAPLFPLAMCRGTWWVMRSRCYMAAGTTSRPMARFGVLAAVAADWAPYHYWTLGLGRSLWLDLDR